MGNPIFLAKRDLPFVLLAMVLTFLISAVSPEQYTTGIQVIAGVLAVVFHNMYVERYHNKKELK